MTVKPLKLRAKDAEDLQVISAFLQDSIAPVSDMLFNEAEKNFIMVVHRLCREAETEESRERVCCAVNMRGVASVQTTGIDLKDREKLLDLLAVLSDPGTVTFVFAAGAQIRLKLADWSLIVEDFGEPWPALCNPCHEEQGSEARG